MRTLDFSRYAFSVSVAAAILSSCGGSQPPIGASGAMPQTSAITTHGARWPVVGIPAPDSGMRGIYVSEFYGTEILGYAPNKHRNKPPLCYVPGVSYVNDVAVDGKGNLIDPDGGSRTIKVFKGPGMCGPQLGSVSDPYGQPSDATSADAATGTIVIANEFDGPPSKNYPGSISLCTLKAGCTTNLTNPRIYEVAGVAQSKNGDCWASATTSSGKAALFYFKHCAGPGQAATHFQNQYFGGLDIDNSGNLVAISFADANLYVYKGCNRDCTLVSGPFSMRGLPFFGHLNEGSTRFATVDNSFVQVDVYSYNPASLQYLYSFSGVSESSDLGGVAYNPRSKE